MIEVTNSNPPAMISITGSLSAPACAKKRPSVALCPNAEPPAVNTINAIPRPAVRPSPDRIFSSLPSPIMRSGEWRQAGSRMMGSFGGGSPGGT